jgi:hypothetical protein
VGMTKVKGGDCKLEFVSPTRCCWLITYRIHCTVSVQIK